ncbi:MAG: hypothetical protein RR202_02580 [Bacteroidales bacterium]
MKKTKYLNGLVTLSVASIFASGCTGAKQTKETDANWMNTDTVPGKVVHDNNGNEWIWHGGGYHGGGLTNMLMGYWLINSMTGAQNRYYPSSHSYTGDMDRNAAPTGRPSYVSPTPTKAREGVMSTVPTAAAPLNRAAIKSGKYVMPESAMKPATRTSSRGGFGRTGSGSRSVGA